MALTDRIVEHPGRVVLTPVSGEENTYDMVRSEGTVTQEGTELNAANLTAAFGLVTEEYTGSVTYEAGTIGTRAVAVNLGTAVKTGMTLVSALLISASSASSYSVQLYVSSGNLYAAIYRATASAVNSAAITVRATWMPTSA